MSKLTEETIIKAIDCNHVGRRYWFDVVECTHVPYLTITDVVTNRKIYPRDGLNVIIELLSKNEKEQILYLEKRFEDAI